MQKIHARKNCVCQIDFLSSESYTDSYNEVVLDVVFEGSGGLSLTVPAFWCGERQWAVRFSAERTGDYHFRSVCSHTEDAGLHDVTGVVTVKPYMGTNPLLQHGRLRVSDDKSHFVYADNTPFFWIGDTWWMALAGRLALEDFKKLSRDRVEKEFNVIQLVAGLYPEMDEEDPRGANEAGFPFTKDFACINPAFYDHVDLKLQHLVASGLMPCVFGSWGYYLPKLGMQKMKQYWRYLVARYGAYPVVWCLAGEATMPYYLSGSKKEDEALQQKGWREMASYVREIDPFRNLLSIHPDIQGAHSANARDIAGGQTFDFEMLQAGHHGFGALPNTESEVLRACARNPKMPVINAEVNYEGIGGQCWQDVQRLSFYISIFNGAVGYTYGANGVWQVNQKDKPYGPSPHGMNWGNMPWEEAAKLPGGMQVALGGKLMQQFSWWKFKQHPEWVESQQEASGWRKILCIGIPKKLRLIYVPQLWMPPLVKNIESEVVYEAYYFDPCTGAQHKLGLVHADKQGHWQASFPPEVHDWLIVLQACAHETI